MSYILPFNVCISFVIVLGVMLFSLLYFSCLSLRLFVSSMARRMDSVIVSAYIMTLPLKFLAALPMVCMSAVSERRNPSLSASSMATSDTSGMSRPSRRRLMPISASNLPCLSSLIICTRSSVSTSLCRYLHFTFLSLR